MGARPSSRRFFFDPTPRVLALGVVILTLLLIPRPTFATEENTSTNKTKVKPAKLSIEGYGLLGNRELKRILRTVELGGRKPLVFDPSFIEDSALILTAKVKRDGYLQPRIDIHLKLEDGHPIIIRADSLLENPLPRPLRIKQASFRIQKGLLYHFEHLDFSGLESITEKQARAFFIESETLLHLKSARIFTPERLQAGLSSLNDSLDRKGYQQVTAQADRVVRDDKNGNVDVHITVQQGPKFVVHHVYEEFYYGTNSVAVSNRTVRVEKAFSRLWQQDFTLALKTNQYRLGFPDTSVQMEQLHRTEGPRQVDFDLQAKVNAGEQIRIADVKFKGQKLTRTSLLSRRAKVERGELLNPIAVEEGRARLSRLGVFESVDLQYQPAKENTRNVLYQVTEGKRLNVSLLFGYGSYELLRGGVDLEAYNFWGLAHRAELQAVQSFKASSGSLTYTIPEFVGREIDLFLNGSALRREEVSFTRLEYGGGFGVHKYLPSVATDISARYNYQILNAQQFGTIEEVANEGLTNPAVGAIIFEIKKDHRDNPLYPSRGYKVFATVETATEYLGGDANYERIEVSPSWHHPLGGGRFLSLGLSHGVAVSFGSPSENLPFNKRYFLGGENSIRGYTEGEASPRNSVGEIVGAETFTLGTVELEQALTPKWSLVIFSDNLGFARRIQHYPWDTGLFSVGAGVRWRTLIGPIRLEYGYNLNPRAKDPTGTLQFSVGFPF